MDFWLFCLSGTGLPSFVFHGTDLGPYIYVCVCVCVCVCVYFLNSDDTETIGAMFEQPKHHIKMAVLMLLLSTGCY